MEKQRGTYSSNFPTIIPACCTYLCAQKTGLWYPLQLLVFKQVHQHDPTLLADLVSILQLLNPKAAECFLPSIPVLIFLPPICQLFPNAWRT